MLRAVLDTNVIVSAFIRPDGASGQILELVTHGKFQVVLSPALLDELRRTLQRPGVRRYVQVSEEELEVRLAQLQILADTVGGTQKLDLVLRDPKDLPIVVAAIEGRASTIVTGDDDLLSIGAYESVLIMSPRQFLAYLQTVT